MENVAAAATVAATILLVVPAEGNMAAWLLTGLEGSLISADSEASLTLLIARPAS